MAKVSIAGFVVRSGAGIDLEATLDKFSAAFQDFMVKEEETNQKVAKFVHAVFDTYPGCKFNMASITSFTLKEANAAPDQYPALSEAIHTYIKNNAGERDSGALFMVSRGNKKNGNVARWNDLPADKPSE